MLSSKQEICQGSPLLLVLDSLNQLQCSESCFDCATKSRTNKLWGGWLSIHWRCWGHGRRAPAKYAVASTFEGNEAATTPLLNSPFPRGWPVMCFKTHKVPVQKPFGWESHLRHKWIELRRGNSGPLTTSESTPRRTLAALTPERKARAKRPKGVHAADCRSRQPRSRPAIGPRSSSNKDLGVSAARMACSHSGVQAVAFRPTRGTFTYSSIGSASPETNSKLPSEASSSALDELPAMSACTRRSPAITESIWSERLGLEVMHGIAGTCASAPAILAGDNQLVDWQKSAKLQRASPKDLCSSWRLPPHQDRRHSSTHSRKLQPPPRWCHPRGNLRKQAQPTNELHGGSQGASWCSTWTERSWATCHSCSFMRWDNIYCLGWCVWGSMILYSASGWRMTNR